MDREQRIPFQLSDQRDVVYGVSCVVKREENFQSDIGNNTLGDSINPNPSQKRIDSEELSVLPPSPFAELISHVRAYLIYLKNLVRLSEGRFVDKRFEEHFSQSLYKALESLDILLKEYLDYARVSTPLEKRDTVHSLIDEIVKRYKALLDEKGVTLFKKFEQNLPETTVPEDPLRFILSSLLWYALTWISPIAGMGFLTQTLPVRIETSSENGTLLKAERQDLKIIMILSGHQEPTRFPAPPVESPVLQKEGVAGFMLRLIEDIVRDNHGSFRAGTDRKKGWVLFSLTFPVERRKKTYYRPEQA